MGEDSESESESEEEEEEEVEEEEGREDKEATFTVSIHVATLYLCASVYCTHRETTIIFVSEFLIIMMCFVLPYSAKVLWDKIFADWVSRNIFCGS